MATTDPPETLGAVGRARAWLRRVAMRSTSLSQPFGGSGRYVRVLYRAWSLVYDASIAVDPAYRRNARRMVEATVPAGGGGRCLDVGVGTGLLAEVAPVRSAAWVGVDLSTAMLARARRKVRRAGLGYVALLRADARRLPFRDGAFDAIVSSFVLPHFARDERAAVLAELRRVLAPGGRLGLHLAQGEVAPLFSTRAELERDLERAGFTGVEIEDRDDVFRRVRAIVG